MPRSKSTHFNNLVITAIILLRQEIIRIQLWGPFAGGDA